MRWYLILLVSCKMELLWNRTNICESPLNNYSPYFFTVPKWQIGAITSTLSRNLYGLESVSYILGNWIQVGNIQIKIAISMLEANIIGNNWLLKDTENHITLKMVPNLKLLNEVRGYSYKPKTKRIKNCMKLQQNFCLFGQQQQSDWSGHHYGPEGK